MPAILKLPAAILTVAAIQFAGSAQAGERKPALWHEMAMRCVIE